ncbi:Golgi integral membrane protein 4-like isoform X1 [Leptopilina heterotoma]|uniref:Golgi integral membrane protein 4-like isoform X1 n=1 Tax=Leptopilina heterotoma TaxID=63436 RepID=UPI001CA86C2C|nr:Golgi integral membrane protein 4-like isoform X1 [Leptopilina heterotoma]
MNASRLGRGRGGRLALYGGVLIIFVIIIYLYRAASFEMARLHDIHVQCAHQQESIAAQLQVIYEYKVRLEKSLQEEKNSNQALKQELQQRASREKSLRDKDKDNVELLQRYNAMQQKYNILQSENKDLQDECNKRHKLSLEETNKLEVTLRNLRSEIIKAQEDKKSSMESLKNKHAQLKVDYDSLSSKYEKLVKNSSECNSQMLHLEKKVFQLTREQGGEKKKIVSDYNAAASKNQQESNNEKSRGNSGNDQVAAPIQQQQQQQKLPAMIVGRILPGMIVESSTKVSTPSISIEKQNYNIGKAKVKLPIGVVPIPVIMDSKNDNEEKKRDELRKNSEVIKNSLGANGILDVDGVKEKPVAVDIGNLEFQAHLPAGNRHGAQIIDRQINAGWPKVQHGVQEIGDEPHHLERLAGLDDTAHQGEIGDDQYDNDEFYRDQQPKNSDIRIEEEEDEAGDEDDQPDYLNNLKPEKH